MTFRNLTKLHLHLQSIQAIPLCLNLETVQFSTNLNLTIKAKMMVVMQNQQAVLVKQCLLTANIVQLITNRQKMRLVLQLLREKQENKNYLTCLPTKFDSIQLLLFNEIIPLVVTLVTLLITLALSCCWLTNP